MSVILYCFKLKSLMLRILASKSTRLFNYNSFLQLFYTNILYIASSPTLDKIGSVKIRNPIA